MILNNSRLVVANRAIYAAPNCLVHRQAMKWEIPRNNGHFYGFARSVVFNLTDLESEVQESLQCRICDRSVAAGGWAWQRFESKAHVILNPDGIVS